MTYPLVHRRTQAAVDAETFAGAAGLHPTTVRRWADLGLLEVVTDPAGTAWFPVSQLAVVGRIHRLRRGLGLNYAAVGLVMDLLDRIAELEARHPHPTSTQHRGPGGR